MASVDYENAVSADVIPGVDMTRFNLLARFPRAGMASAVMQRLRQSGGPVEDAALLGRSDDVVHTTYGLARRDERVLGGAITHMLRWSAAGAVIGAIIGIVIFAIPAFRTAVHAPADAIGFIVAALIGALVCSTIGGLVGYVAGIDRSSTGVDTYDETQDSSPELVGIHAQADRVDEVIELLRTYGATRVDRLGRGAAPAR
jgi:hypothetical protein